MPLLEHRPRSRQGLSRAPEAGGPVTPYYQDDLVTIYHGDALEPVMQFVWPTSGVLVTDPPYGIDYRSAQKGSLPRSIVGDKDTGARDTALEWWLRLTEGTAPDGRCCVRYDRQFYVIQREARSAYAKALRDGTLVRPDSCSVCGDRSYTIEGHHPDYREPLYVRWLCGVCHGAAHRVIRDRLVALRYRRWRAAFDAGVRDFSRWDYQLGIEEFVEAAA